MTLDSKVVTPLARPSNRPVSLCDMNGGWNGKLPAPYGDGPFVRLPREVIESGAYESLSHAARLLLIDWIGFVNTKRYVGVSGGLPFTPAQCRTGLSRRRFYGCMAAIERAGFVTSNSKGRGHATLYEPSTRWQSYIENEGDNVPTGEGHSVPTLGGKLGTERPHQEGHSVPTFGDKLGTQRPHQEGHSVPTLGGKLGTERPSSKNPFEEPTTKEPRGGGITSIRNVLAGMAVVGGGKETAD